MGTRYPWPEWADPFVLLAAIVAAINSWAYVLVRLATWGVH